MRLKDKVAVITGAGVGVGRAAALLFAREGASLVLCDIADSGAAAADDVRAAGGAALFVRADVSRAADAERLIAETVSRCGRIDILYNNAGILGKVAPVGDVQEDDWDRVIAINLKSVFLCCRYAVREMEKRKYGVIVNSASMMGMVGLPGNTAYSASKGGIIQFTRTMALEYAASNIRVNCLCAGWLDTPMNARLDERVLKWTVRETPLGRLGTAAEVAQAALYLASDESSFVTGSALVIDGGWTAK